MFKPIKEKVLDTITEDPKMVTLVIGLAITLVIATSI